MARASIQAMYMALVVYAVDFRAKGQAHSPTPISLRFSYSYDGHSNVELFNICNRQEHAVKISYSKNECFNLYTVNIPLLQVSTDPDHISLTFFDHENCYGNTFYYDGRNFNGRIPFNPASVKINKR